MHDDDRNLLQIFTYTFLKIVYELYFYILHSMFEHYKKYGLYTRRPLDCHYIFLCKVTVLYCIDMPEDGQSTG